MHGQMNDPILTHKNLHEYILSFPEVWYNHFQKNKQTDEQIFCVTILSNGTKFDKFEIRKNKQKLQILDKV